MEITILSCFEKKAMIYICTVEQQRKDKRLKELKKQGSLKIHSGLSGRHTSRIFIMIANMPKKNRKDNAAIKNNMFKFRARKK